VPLSGDNAKRVLFGALNIDTGYRVFLAREHQRGADFRAFLRLVRQRYRGRYVALVLDEDSSHTAGASQALAGALGIELLWLPKRSPHLNPVDHLWRHGKEVTCGNHQYGSIEEQVERFTAYLDSLTPEQALLKAGVLSDDFWIW
jgi:transposase